MVGVESLEADLSSLLESVTKLSTYLLLEGECESVTSQPSLLSREESGDFYISIC